MLMVLERTLLIWQTTSDFQTPYAMEVAFIRNTQSLRASIKHNLVAVP